MNPLIKKLIEKQNAAVPNSSMSGSDLSSEVKIWIPTGDYKLDITISNKEQGGWPCGRVVEIFGKESIGKTTLVLNGMKNCQAMGGIGIFYDVEQAGAFEMMEACGVDRENMIYNNSTSIEDVATSLEETLKEISKEKSMKNKPVLCIIDSIAALVTDAELEAGYENNMNLGGLKPKQLGKFLRKISPFLKEANCCLILLNQMRQTIGISYGDPDVAPGGKAKDFFASLRIKLLGMKKIEVAEAVMTDEQYLQIVEDWKAGGKEGPKPKRPKGEGLVLGCDVNAKLIKNKVGIPHRETTFRIMFLQGVRESKTLLDFLEDNDYVAKSGAWYTWLDPDKDCPIPDGEKFQEKGWEEYLSDYDVYEWVKAKIRKKTIKKIDMSKIKEDDLQESEFDLGEDEKVVTKKIKATKED